MAPARTASLASIAWVVSNLATGASLGSGSFTVASCVYDALQQDDPRWSADSAIHPGADGSWGYNFAGELAATLFPATALAAPGALAGPAAPQRLQADVAFTPVLGQPLRVIWSWQQLPVYG